MSDFNGGGIYLQWNETVIKTSKIRIRKQLLPSGQRWMLSQRISKVLWEILSPSTCIPDFMCPSPVHMHRLLQPSLSLILCKTSAIQLGCLNYNSCPETGCIPVNWHQLLTSLIALSGEYDAQVVYVIFSLLPLKFLPQCVWRFVCLTSMLFQ